MAQLARQASILPAEALPSMGEVNSAVVSGDANGAEDAGLPPSEKPRL
jgi:hypothetical protein